ncbi:MAG: hypothetical protein F6J95_033535 [Leptolyngbya sp. SIO1E4]|nr:hypothetical protein [Leptolyngbya sp. SIO1E4]MBE7386299.1 hypothetical protein [Leptolyngbya sp. SIO1E4]
MLEKCVDSARECPSGTSIAVAAPASHATVDFDELCRETLDKDAIA